MEKYPRVAIAEYDQAIYLNPNNDRAYYGRGKNYFNIQKYVESANDFRCALNIASKVQVEDTEEAKKSAYIEKIQRYLDMAQKLAPKLPQTVKQSTMTSIFNTSFKK